MKKISLFTLIAFLVNYFFTAIYVPFLSPVTYPHTKLHNFQDLIDFIYSIFQIPIMWYHAIFITSGVFFDQCSAIIKDADSFIDLFSFPPIFASAFMLAGVALILFLLAVRKWKNLKTSTKFTLPILTTLCFNIVVVDCFALAMKS